MSAAYATFLLGEILPEVRKHVKITDDPEGHGVGGCSSGGIASFRTLRLLDAARQVRPNVGVCVQAYLRRTESDVDALIVSGAAVRLVKGAYAEPSSLAFPDKADVDENYLRLAKKLLGKEAWWNGVRAALATHDQKLVNRIIVWAAAEGIPQEELEFQMLYGIQAQRQKDLAERGHRCRVLISYGNSWFPWYMRRLAERPANLWFVVKNVV